MTFLVSNHAFASLFYQVTIWYSSLQKASFTGPYIIYQHIHQKYTLQNQPAYSLKLSALFWLDIL